MTALKKPTERERKFEKQQKNEYDGKISFERPGALCARHAATFFTSDDQVTGW